MNEKSLIEKSEETGSKDIIDLIYHIRENRVMLDKDLAGLYQVETKVLNQSVKRNISRFPGEFMFQLNENEFKALRSQFVTLDKSRGTHTKYLPYAFTEQGVAMLSTILRTEKAVSISINIMKAFTLFRNIITVNSTIFERVDNLEIKLLDTDRKIDLVLNAMSKQELEQGIFFKGQLFDAHAFVSNLVRSAKKSLVLIDNYIDDTVFLLFNKRDPKVMLEIITSKITKELQLDLEKYQRQYDNVLMIECHDFHDRFLIIDRHLVYHFGASLKDLGKKCFAFNKLDHKMSHLLMDHLEKLLKT